MDVDRARGRRGRGKGPPTGQQSKGEGTTMGGKGGTEYDAYADAARTRVAKAGEVGQALCDCSAIAHCG